jgi:hypothetical protein
VGNIFTKALHTSLLSAYVRFPLVFFILRRCFED